MDTSIAPEIRPRIVNTRFIGELHNEFKQIQHLDSCDWSLKDNTKSWCDNNNQSYRYIIADCELLFSNHFDYNQVGILPDDITLDDVVFQLRNLHIKYSKQCNPVSKIQYITSNNSLSVTFNE